MPRKILGRIAPDEASIRLRSTGADFHKSVHEETNGVARVGSVPMDDHSSANGRAVHDVA
jgi:hypothetical protein